MRLERISLAVCCRMLFFCRNLTSVSRANAKRKSEGYGARHVPRASYTWSLEPSADKNRKLRLAKVQATKLMRETLDQLGRAFIPKQDKGEMRFTPLRWQGKTRTLPETATRYYCNTKK